MHNVLAGNVELIILTPKFYRPKHTVDSCKCEFVGSNPTQLVSMIQHGDVPIVSCFYSSG